MSNELRMPFAEWLYRMKQSDLPPQAMMLAVGAVFFKVTSNEQLARMVNMDTRGIADKTYNKWKYQLSRDGWVIIRQITVGRRTTIEVHPAYKESPVKFTSFRAIDPAKLQDASLVNITDETDEIEPVTITSEDRKSYGTRHVETTGEERNSYEPAVEITAEVKESSPHTPLKENTTSLPSNPVVVVEENNNTARVEVNGSAIRGLSKGKRFTLDFGAIDIAATLAGRSTERGRQMAEMMARDWVANGTVPDNPMAMVARRIKTDQNNDLIDEVRRSKAVTQETRSERLKRKAEEIAKKIQGGR